MRPFGPNFRPNLGYSRQCLFGPQLTTEFIGVNHTTNLLSPFLLGAQREENDEEACAMHIAVVARVGPSGDSHRSLFGLVLSGHRRISLSDRRRDSIPQQQHEME
jgi:hypothetical protein